MEKHELRILALTERLMDEGKLNWVLAPSIFRQGSYDRLPVSDDIMEDLGLVKGQKINSILFDSIAELSMQRLRTLVEDSKQKEEDSALDENFDFRDMMGNNNGE